MGKSLSKFMVCCIEQMETEPLLTSRKTHLNLSIKSSAEMEVDLREKKRGFQPCSRHKA